MGIDNTFLQFLAESTKSGVSLAKTATFGGRIKLGRNSCWESWR
jgi:hypothetical protein